MVSGCGCLSESGGGGTSASCFSNPVSLFRGSYFGPLFLLSSWRLSVPDLILVLTYYSLVYQLTSK